MLHKNLKLPLMTSQQNKGNMTDMQCFHFLAPYRLKSYEFNRKYVLAPSDKAANFGTKAYKETSTDEKTVVNSHSNYLPY